MNANVNLAELIRRIQYLVNTNRTPEQEEELNFYVALHATINQIFTRGYVENLVPIKCPLDTAQSLAMPLGLQAVQGGSGNVYIGWIKNMDV